MTLKAFSGISAIIPMNVKELSSPVSLLDLPDDLLWNCLARVSRLYYPLLSFVSKRFRSLLTSAEVYQTRTILGRTQSCLYVYFVFSGSSHLQPHWFTLCRRPTRIPNPNPQLHWFTHFVGHNPNIMVSVPTPNISPLFWSLIALGSNIYKIGGHNGEYSSKVFFMDCRSHTWHEAPSMRVARNDPRVNVLDGKIYVVAGTPKSHNYIECFDPKTQTWEDVQPPGAEIRGSYVSASLAIEGKLYLFGDKSVIYNPEENRWDAVELDIHHLRKQFDFGWGMAITNFCVIDDVLYCAKSSTTISWYDFKVRSWKLLKGLKEQLKLPNSGYARLANYGGKIAALWEENVQDISKKKNIWCAEIALDKRNELQEIYGKIEWCEVVLKVPNSFPLLQLIAAATV